VTGVVDFGVFVKLEQGLEGLAHISELDWGLVENPHTLFSVGDAVKVKVIEIKDGKISLSIKALKENPWHTAAERYAKDMEVPGVIIKYNKHGALASIEEGVAGLVHVSEFESPAALRETPVRDKQLAAIRKPEGAEPLAHRLGIERGGGRFPVEDEGLPEELLQEVLGECKRMRENLAEREVDG